MSQREDWRCGHYSLSSSSIPAYHLTVDSIQGLPHEALLATTISHFSTHMKPFLWTQFPSYSSAEINAIVNSKWKALKAARKEQAGAIGAVERRRRSEIESLEGRQVEEREGGREGEEEEEGVRRPSRRRAAKNLAKNAYTMDLDEQGQSPN